MFGIDTNVLVRYLIRDDQLQFEKSRRLIKRAAGFDAKPLQLAKFISVSGAA